MKKTHGIMLITYTKGDDDDERMGQRKNMHEGVGCPSSFLLSTPLPSTSSSSSSSSCSVGTASVANIDVIEIIAR